MFYLLQPCAAVERCSVPCFDPHKQAHAWQGLLRGLHAQSPKQVFQRVPCGGMVFVGFGCNQTWRGLLRGLHARQRQQILQRVPCSGGLRSGRLLCAPRRRRCVRAVAVGVRCLRVVSAVQANEVCCAIGDLNRCSINSEKCIVQNLECTG